MEYVIKALLLGLFLLAAFGRGMVPSEFLYWSIYPFMLILVISYWYVKYYVSKGSISKVLRKNISDSYFVGKVPTNVQDDLLRGRFSVIDGEVVLVHRDKKSKYIVEKEGNVSEIKSIGFGKVVGIRKGFTIYYKNGDFASYTNLLIYKKRELLFKLLGWEKNEK